MANRSVREVLQEFYDEFGWRKDAKSGRYCGECLHEDLDPYVMVAIGRYIAVRVEKHG